MGKQSTFQEASKRISAAIKATVPGSSEKGNDRAARIAKACLDHGCSEKIAEIHFEQFMLRGWNPHPPEEFIRWWRDHDFSQTFSAVKAWNSNSFRKEYFERREVCAAGTGILYAKNDQPTNEPVAPKSFAIPRVDTNPVVVLNKIKQNVSGMIGEVTGWDDIENPRMGKNGKPYIFIFFKMEDGTSAKTYLVKPFKNYDRWMKFLKIGAKVKGLIWKDKKNGLIDADSIPQ